MSIEFSDRLYQHSPLIYSFPILGRYAFIHRTTKKEYKRMFVFEQNPKNTLLEWRLKATDNHGVCVTHRLGPSHTATLYFRGEGTGTIEGDKMSIQQISISK